MGIIIPEIHTSLTSLQAVLEVNRATLQRLRSRRVLNATQWSKLYPTLATSVPLANFDITLMFVLICGLNRSSCNHRILGLRHGLPGMYQKLYLCSCREGLFV